MEFLKDISRVQCTCTKQLYALPLVAIATNLRRCDWWTTRGGWLWFDKCAWAREIDVTCRLFHRVQVPCVLLSNRNEHFAGITMNTTCINSYLIPHQKQQQASIINPCVARFSLVRYTFFLPLLLTFISFWIYIYIAYKYILSNRRPTHTNTGVLKHTKGCRESICS